jgi:hypothetical protein
MNGFMRTGPGRKARNYKTKSSTAETLERLLQVIEAGDLNNESQAQLKRR